jgi:DNA adenine methylase
MDYYSPLRYPGGKGKIATSFKQIFKDNFLYDGVYIEPYAGGASVALSLLLNEYASKIIINDIDPAIYAFWHSVLFSTDELCELIKDTPVNLDVWKIQREIQKRSANVSTVQLGFSTFFLNRTNRSGIINAGVIGGVNQNGKWKIDVRYNKSDLIKRIERIALHKDRITILNLDACQLISKVKKKVSTKSLFYLDPPYYSKGKELYLSYYNDNDHIRVAKEIEQLNNHRWIVTYDNVRFIQKLYSQYRQIRYTLPYTARTFSRGQEIMIFSNNLYMSSLNRKNIVSHRVT